MPPSSKKGVVANWRAAGSLSLREYAPFAAHCLEIDLFFYLAMSNGLISDQRPSNRMDIAYLYYLPFAHLFVSNDKLHRSITPLFLGDDQRFIWANDLKKNLSALVGTFAALPESEKEKGLFALASRPPAAHEGLITDLWNRYAPNWRQPEIDPASIAPHVHRDIVDRGNRLMAAAKNNPFIGRPSGEAEHVIIKRFIPRTRGSWQMFSHDMEEIEPSTSQ